MKNKIRMPKNLLKRWLKALRGGTYIQAKGILYDKAVGGFCCLGVLQHVQSGGSCEVNFGDHYRSTPSDGWSKEAQVDFGDHMHKLMVMNDGDIGRRRRSFTQIANYIEKNSEGF
jgi:hypothetical protein